MTQRSPKVTCSGRYSDGMSRGKNIQGGVHLQNQWNRIPSGNSLILDIYICLIPVSLHKDHWWDRLMSYRNSLFSSGAIFILDRFPTHEACDLNVKLMEISVLQWLDEIFEYQINNQVKKLNAKLQTCCFPTRSRIWWWFKRLIRYAMRLKIIRVIWDNASYHRHKCNIVNRLISKYVCTYLYSLNWPNTPTVPLCLIGLHICAVLFGKTDIWK